MSFIRFVRIFYSSTTGAGKTLAHVIAILQKIDTSNQQCQALILAPCRELSYCIARFITSFATHINVRVHCCFGGTPVRDDMLALKAGVQILVGSPGRIHDMLARRALDLSSLSFVVFEDADRLLDRGFHECISGIYRHLPARSPQVAIVTTTVTPEMTEFADKVATNPLYVTEQLLLLSQQSNATVT